MAAQDTSCLSSIDNDLRLTSHVEYEHRHRINQYIRHQRVGKGQHGEVLRCIDENFVGREVAVKAVRRITPRDKIKLLRRNYQQAAKDRKLPSLTSTEQSVRREVAVMRKCRHIHIARLFEVIDDPQHEKIYLVMEYIPGGEVQWKDDEERPVLSVEQSRRILRDVILGLEYLHHEKIIHRDIKPSNLIWTQDRAYVKIIDFGVAHFSPNAPKPKPSEQSDDPYDDSLFHETDLLKRTGTPSFLAPEIVWVFDNTPQQSPSSSGETLASAPNSITVRRSNHLPRDRPPVTNAIDVWSLGITLYCFLFGRTPFNVPESANENAYHNEFALYNEICTQDWEVDETMGFDRIYTSGRYPRERKSEGSMAVSLLDQMLQKDPNNRITVSELKRNRWILRGILEPKEWITKTSPPGIVTDSENIPPVSRWKQASQKIWEFVPRPGRTLAI